MISDGSAVFPLHLHDVIDLIKEHKWRSVMDHLTSSHFLNEVKSCVYNYPITLLHIACTIPSVPVDVIKILIQVYPHACLAEDEDCRLPIHLASTTAGINFKVIRTLMRACPKSCFIADCMDGSLPLYLLLKNNGVGNINLRVKHLISSIPAACVYKEDTSLMHGFSDDMLPDIILNQVLKMYPQVCHIQNENSDTLLHLLCSHKHSTLQTIFDVANMYPEACAKTNSDGSLPLHLVNSEKENEGVIKILLDLHPRSICVSNFAGNVPLMTRNYRESPMKVKAILSYSDQACIRLLLHTRNYTGLLPVEELFHEIQCDLSSMYHRQGSSFLHMQHTLKVTNQIKSLTYLMRAYVYGSVDNMSIGNKLSGVHNILFWTAFPLFTKMLLKHFPHLIKEQDDNGELPLHILTKDSYTTNVIHQCSICSNFPIRGPYSWHSANGIGIHICDKCTEKPSRCHLNDTRLLELPKRMPLVEYQSKFKMKHIVQYHIITVIFHLLHAIPFPLFLCNINAIQGYELVRDALKIYPQAASKPDHAGYLPLHLSLYAGKTWNSGIKEIFEAAPDSNLIQDHKTHLFPFMIAASKNDDDNSHLRIKGFPTGQHEPELSIKKQMFLSELTTVYKLLREAPFQVHGGIRI